MPSYGCKSWHLGFASPKPSTDLLAMSVASHEPYYDIVHGAYRIIVDHAEKAMEQAKSCRQQQA